MNNQNKFKPLNVAVYGTLKKGKSNHTILGGSKPLGIGSTLPLYSMISFGGFPGVLDGEDSIHVEVYEVNDVGILMDLDALEGHPNFFKREEIPIKLDNNKDVYAWMYTVRHHSAYYEKERHSERDEQDRLAWRHDSCDYMEGC